MIKLRFFHSRRGFTLIEIVVVVGVFAIMIFALLNLYLAYGSLYNFQNAQLTTQTEGRAVMSEFSLFTIQGHQVLSNITIATNTYYSGTTTLVLEIPSITSGGSIISNTWDYVVFYVSGKKIYRTIQPDAASARISGTKLLTSNLQSLSITYNNADLTQAQKVSIDLTLQNINVKNTATNHLTEDLILRNF